MNKKLPSFRVHYEEHSAAMHLRKMDVEKKIADMVPSDYPVNLNDPTTTILVSVAGASCMMSVVHDRPARVGLRRDRAKGRLVRAGEGAHGL